MPKVVDREQRRGEIVAAMWRVVERDGAAAVSVRAVAAEAGVAKTGMSYYFASQGELLASAIEGSIETVTDRILQMDLLECDVQTAVSALMELIPGDELRRQQSRVWLQLLVLEPGDPRIPPALHSLNVAVRDSVVVVLTALSNQTPPVPTNPRVQTTHRTRTVPSSSRRPFSSREPWGNQEAEEDWRSH